MTAYQADFEKVVVAIGPDGARTESRELFRLYRDSSGRTRMEGSMPIGGEPMRLAFIADRRGTRRAILDLATGSRLDFPPRSRPPGAPAPSPKPPRATPQPESPTVEDLGEAEIEGFKARGSRTTSSTFGVSEVWHALLIDQPPILVKSKGPTEERTERLFNIRVGEPDPALFAPLEQEP
jgi:hypothetical protein